MNEKEIEAKAMVVVEQAAGEPIVFVGLPQGMGQLPDQSDFTITSCTGCGRPVQSTRILCVNCMIRFISLNKNVLNEIKRI
jgi:hypothetical protein